MHGLPRAALLANQQIVHTLAPAGFVAAHQTLGLFVHTPKPIMFALIVDDFGIQYVGKPAANFCIFTLKQDHTIPIDWIGTKWDYTERFVELSMPGYVARALERFAHTDPPPSDSPHQHVPPQCGAKVQMTALDTSPPLDADATTRIHAIVGVFPHCARTINNTMLVALGTVALQQASATEATANACIDLLNYVATHPDGIIKCFASMVVLHKYTDASYLSEAKARSPASGFFFLSTHPDKLNGLTSMSLLASCATSSLRPPKPRPALLASMLKPLPPSGMLSMKWDGLACCCHHN